MTTRPLHASCFDLGCEDLACELRHGRMMNLLYLTYSSQLSASVGYMHLSGNVMSGRSLQRHANATRPPFQKAWHQAVP